MSANQNVHRNISDQRWFCDRKTIEKEVYRLDSLGFECVYVYVPSALRGSNPKQRPISSFNINAQTVQFICKHEIASQINPTNWQNTLRHRDFSTWIRFFLLDFRFDLRYFWHIFAFHRSMWTGDTGSNLVEWIRFLIGKDMQFPHLKVIIPTAPVQPYTPLEGEVISMQIIWLWLYSFFLRFPLLYIWIDETRRRKLNVRYHQKLELKRRLLYSLPFSSSSIENTISVTSISFITRQLCAFIHEIAYFLQPSHVWFDRLAISKKAKECRTSMEAAYEYVNDLIQTEKDNGIPPNRIVIGNLMQNHGFFETFLLFYHD